VPLGIGPNYIDTFVVKVGALYHAFTKNETTKYIEHATSDALTGPWTFVGKGDWAGWGSGKEGPALFQLESGEWRLFMDCYGNCGYLQAKSTDLNTWSASSTVPVLSGVVRHGTVLREDDSVGGSGGTSGGGGASHGGPNNAGTSGMSASSGGAGGASSPGHSGSGGSGGAFSAQGGSPAAAAGAANPVGSGGFPAVGGAVNGTGGMTSHAGTPGVSLAGASAQSTPASDACSCSLPNARRSPGWALTLLFAAFAVLKRRRLSPAR
jgi:MYXO-CTERM domain-containing protein